MSTLSERMQVLEMIENGLITPAEGATLLQALGESGSRLRGDQVSEPTESLVETQTAQGFPPTDALYPHPFDSSQQAAVNVISPVSDQFSTTELSTSDADMIETAPDFTAPPSTDSFPHENGTPMSQPSPQIGAFDPNLARWRRYWMIPLWIGVGITVLGGLLLFWAYQAGGFSFWFGCAWLPFILGLAVMVMAVASRTARWLHLRVHQKPGERPQTIALSFPLPLRLTAWLIRNFGHHIPQLKNTGIDEMILALGKHTSSETPFYVEVDEGEDGEKVQVYIG